MATGDVFDQFEELLVEEVSRRVHDLILDTDDISHQVLDGVEPVMTGGKRADGNAGYEAKWKIRVQRGGIVSGGGFAGNTLTKAGPSNVLIMGQAADEKYLDPAYTPVRSYIPAFVRLKRKKGSVTLNKAQILADLAANPVEEVAYDETEDAVVNLRHAFSCDFWGDGSGMLARVNNSAGYTIAEGSQQACAVDWGTISRFMVGKRYVAGSHVALADYGTSQRTGRAGSLNSPGVFRCTDIDVDNLTVSFESEAGEGNISLSDND
ncbi:MAG: hypothetical protein ACYSUI_22245, partial [Planctomycetota bacterium]